MKFISAVITVLLLSVTILTITSCGKMSENRPIEGSGYPHIYPRK